MRGAYEYLMMSNSLDFICEPKFGIMFGGFLGGVACRIF
jgi:hypothetical protein